jgi:7-cyano-7-deazaguanine reductase
MNSFRNHGSFHESIANTIGSRIAAVVEPDWIRVTCLFAARGGIPIDITWQAGELPENMFVLPIEHSDFRGR